MSTQEPSDKLTDNLLELIKIQKDLLLAEYIEARNHARHVETVRTSAVNFALLLASALIAVITFDKTIARSDLTAALLILAIGVSCMAFSVLYLERYEVNTYRARCIRNEIDRLFFEHRGLGEQLGNLRKRGAAEEIRDESRQRRIWRPIVRGTMMIARGTHLFWILMPLIVSIVGLILVVVSAFYPTVIPMQ